MEAFITRRGGGGGSGAQKKGTIVVSFPTGATCAVTSGSKIYTALDTSGAAAFVVEPGTWTVRAYGTDGDASESVSVTAGGWVSVKLSYAVMLYEVGNDHSDITGGWVSSGNGAMNASALGLVSRTNNNGALLKVKSINKIDVTNRAALQMTFSQVGITASQGAYANVCLFDAALNPIATEAAVSSAAEQMVQLDISGYSGEYYVGLALRAGNDYYPPAGAGIEVMHYPSSATITQVKLI